MADREIVKPEPSHKYFHQMLNMAEDELDPYEYRVLGHYIRWAGIGGAAREGIKQGNECCRMGINTFRDARMRLVEKGYLILTPPTDDEIKAGIATVVEVVDRWAENIAKYSPLSDRIWVSEGKPLSDQIGHPLSDQIHSEDKDLKNKDQKKSRISAKSATPPKLPKFNAKIDTVKDDQQEEDRQIVIIVNGLLKNGKLSESMKTRFEVKVICASSIGLPVHFPSPADLYDEDTLFQQFVAYAIADEVKYSNHGVTPSKAIRRIIDYDALNGWLAYEKKNRAGHAETSGATAFTDEDDL